LRRPRLPALVAVDNPHYRKITGVPMDDFIHQQGPAFLAHLLRRISDELVRGASLWYPEVGVTAPPRTTSTLLALDERGNLGVTELATLLRQSHPLIINWIKQLQGRGFVESHADAQDGRRTVVALTAKGDAEVRRLRQALTLMSEASRKLMGKAAPELFDTLWRMEETCRRQPFAEQLREKHAKAIARKTKA
jgi:DNA-binding MarR family transcriptional regulator